MNGTAPRLAQRVLEAIAAGCDSLPTLSQATALTPLQLNNAVQKLRRRKLIEVRAPGCYRITEAGADWLLSGRSLAGGQCPRRGRLVTRGLRERAWWLMRELRKFTLTDLLTTLADGSEADARSNLAKYLAALEAVGVLRRMRRTVPRLSGTGRGHDIWWLAKDLGRAAPVARHTHREVFDPNAGETLKQEVCHV